MIVEFLGKLLLVETVKQSVKAVSDEIIKGKIDQVRRERISSALISIQQASIETRNFIDNKGYLDRAVKVSHIGRMKVSIANQLLKIDSIEV